MLRSTINDKFLTVHSESVKLCLAEPLEKQGVQHVEAEPVAPYVLQPQHALHVLQLPINQIAPPLVQPIVPTQLNPLVPVVQAAQPLPGPPVQVPAVINPNPLKCRRSRHCCLHTPIMLMRLAE